MEPETLRIIQKIKEFRQKSKLDVCFTLDAGPNIHLLYPGSFKNVITAFIEDELKQHCENEKWIADKIGKGPQRLN